MPRVVHRKRSNFQDSNLTTDIGQVQESHDDKYSRGARDRTQQSVVTVGCTSPWRPPA